jgi:hypothetical protein
VSASVAISEPEVVRQTIPWVDNPYGAVSLFDMIRVYAEHYVSIGKTLEQISSKYSSHSGILVLPQAAITNEDRSYVVDQLRIVKTHCDQLELPVSSEFLIIHLQRYAKYLPSRGEIANCIDSFEITFHAELQGRLFVFVFPEKAHTFEKEMLFGPEVDTAFPSAKLEIVDAGTSFALGLNTACVFHCVRVLEHGLRALAGVFGLLFGLEQWHNIIEQIESKIEALKALPKSQQKVEEQEFYSKSAAHFMFFKDAWRNHVMHGRRFYDDREAYRVLDHTEDFMRHLSTKLSESKATS